MAAALVQVPFDCPFSCIGCNSRNCPEHETEAVTEHMRLLLRAVVGLQKNLGISQPLSARRSMGSRAEAHTGAAAAAEAAEVERTPSSSSAVPAGGVANASSGTMRPGAISDTGKCDLLRLLQSTEAQDHIGPHQAPPSPPPSTPPSPKSVPPKGQTPRIAALAETPSVAAPLVQASTRQAPSPPRSSIDAEAQRTLNAVATELQENKISHADAAKRFTELIDTLPAGKLRCSALLNHAHCLVGLGRYADALADVDAIVHDRAPGVEAAKWHKVWLSRGGIHRKLAQAADGDPTLYAKARSDYEHVLSIQPAHESSMGKARRCLEQLEALERQAASSRTTSHGVQQSGAVSVAPARDDDRVDRRMSVSPEKSNLVRGKVDVQNNCTEDGKNEVEDASEEPSAKRRRHESDVVGDTSSMRTSDIAFVHRSLQALGRECTVAGRALFEEGSVCERRAPTATSAAETSFSPSRIPQRRIFDIRSPDGGEVVVLDCGRACAGSSSTDPAKIGECSCRLRGHCKHVAAVLVALEREDQRMRPGDVVAQSRLEGLERRLEGKTIEELKSYLRLNNQLLGGTKVELLRRVADGVIFGAVPQCPNCNGHLHPEALGGDVTSYRCRKQNRDKDACGYEVPAEAMVRRPFIGADQLS